jgi:F-type H+-transporting ATPase subunit b
MPQYALILNAAETTPLFSLGSELLSSIGTNLFNAIVLAVVLSLILYNPVRKFLKERSDRIAAQFERAKNDEAGALALKAQYEEKLRSINAEREGILDEARKLAAEKGKALLAETEAESNKLKERTQNEIQMEKNRAGEEMRSVIIDLSSVMAHKIVAHTIDKAEQEKIFDQALAELDDITWQI